MRLAHISDLHIMDLSGTRLGQFANRRIIGGLNLLLHRAKEYKADILEVLIEDLLQESVDHVVVSGDVSTMAFEGEFQRCFDLLKLLGDRRKVTLVPGNHDYYTFRAAEVRRFEKTFYPFMFGGGFSDLDTDLYPFVKPLDEVILVGVNSATGTVPPLSYGVVGDSQRKRLVSILKKLASDPRPVCVVLHHALHRRDALTQMTSNLRQADQLLALLEEHGVRLVLYGHDHQARFWKKELKTGTLWLNCCGSSTRLVEDPGLVARYHIFHIEDGLPRRMDTKVYDPAIRRFIPA